ncbi:MAG: hypothetical protein JWQ71_422 [Pedosphaera sp.]|nr:hypothetical protein [Pedosphaera sp.]
MKLLLLLGSGVSFASKLPNVQEITNQVITGAWYRHTDSNYYRVREGSGNQHDAWVRRLQNFLKLLKEFADAYFQTKNRGEATYEDLFFIARAVEDEVSGNTVNPILQPFLKGIEQQLENLAQPIKPIETGFNSAELARKSCEFIECVVWHSLPANTTPEGLDLLIELFESSKLETYDICTLNHDLLIERKFELSGYKYIDGFTDFDGDIKWFDPKLYDARSKWPRLYKLHGSINWWFLENHNSNRRAFGIPRQDTMVWKTAGEERISEVWPRPRFLSGSYNKINDYRFGIFAELQNRFFRLLEEHNAIVISGYGWNDRGINGWLSEWLSISRKNRILLLHKEPESIKHSQSNMWHRYENLVQNGQLIPVKKWFSEISASDLLKQIKEFEKASL